ncbi:bifunctional methylenetetrahydrofolate dehydrogenase/methenyltetrahydrofolate cyclohydrolase FolD [Rhodococcus opacus]|uniref:bifunctional methylenetetrahydrofolate dehydrogenase/methenyltetrahydrofolate cyclohydrolase FolD n=1 Tax=Rhodococcus opacus TaxID=37919 RepID=UPI002236A697|nr:bifunctional methylenetetrahydrofolate dehydrogenase/methenyltetrahydrofolate cyclohydrolase FolD [Rhodococcus opacus]UZG60029.1 bifunctional methylenetetrahydrofolate dehydrogenase/methenyltetrahydrofolate cyclohydrolase FolD [Rhodococcus opacus]
MSATIIDGKAVAQTLRHRVAQEVAALDRRPGLATILVGEDPASAIYVSNKRKLCVEAGMRDRHRLLSAQVSQAEVEDVIDELNLDPEVDGILLQLPLPKHLDAPSLIERIDPDKDVDGLTETNAGRLALGRPGLRPCTPSGVIQLLDSAGIHLEGAHAVVVGRSDLVGRPQAQLLLVRDATVTVCHRHTRDLASHTRDADIVVAAAGVPKLIGAEHIKPGATVIDVGIHRTEGGLCGDVDFDVVAGIAGHITPVPGGVGPMTIATLLRNTLTAANLHNSSHRETRTNGSGPARDGVAVTAGHP